MTNTIISDGQSLVDVCLQELGTIEALFDLADANGLAITDALAAGQTLVVPDSPNTVAAMVDYFANLQRRINTGDEAAPAPDTTAQHYFSSLFFRPDYFA